jgi:hypothetical protein
MPLTPALTMLLWAATSQPALVLTEAKRKVLDNVRRTPNYTCVETVDRSYFEPDGGRAPRSCAEILEQKTNGTQRLKLVMTDRLRLEVAVAPEREMYSWVGEQNFAAGEIHDLVKVGPIGTGSFTSFLSNIFGGPKTTMQYLGIVEEGGRRLMRFRYSVSDEQTRYRVKAGKGWVMTPYSGEVLIDTANSDMAKLSLKTSELPKETGSCESSSALEYMTVRIGASGFLLPKESRQRFVARTGSESENVTVFSGCREYKGESVVRFDVDPEMAAQGTKNEAEAITLSPGLSVVVEWTTPIDTSKAAAGDAVVGKVAKPVRDRRTNVLISAGSRVDGRLMRVQVNHTTPPQVTVVRRVETIEVKGVRVPVSLKNYRPLERGVRPRVFSDPTPFAHEATWEVLRVPGARTVLKGTRSEWVTTR